MLYKCILPDWAKAENPTLRKVVEGKFTDEEIINLNDKGYNIYFFPNYPSTYDPNQYVKGKFVDRFQTVFVDFDLKSGTYADKDTFIAEIATFPLTPSEIIDSGNGIHVYWDIKDLDAKSFLRLNRRLMRRFNTDEAVSTLNQVMRAPGTYNTKLKGDFKRCESLFTSTASYTCEDLDKALPPITPEDEAYCQAHYSKEHVDEASVRIDDLIPPKFHKLLRENKEVKEIWAAPQGDRSKSDWRLGHLMQAAGFSREEALSVLVNTAKALSRGPTHRVGYAEGIVDKIWTEEASKTDEAPFVLEPTVQSILSRSSTDELKGVRFPCHRWIDATEHGFRLGHVLGLVAGSGVGKTAVSLNLFYGFVKNNPDYVHFFIPLEQPSNEIAERWVKICGDNKALHEKVHIMSNYDEHGNFRHLSFDDIKEYILKFQKVTGKKIGCICIDHIGALKKQTKNGENQGLMEICNVMKAFALETNTFLIMQSQAPREKAGIGDIELDKDAAYGTVFFESFCDFLVTLWQPLKRCYAASGCPKITAFKFCKIRHKKVGVDVIHEDVCYFMMFDPETGILSEPTQEIEPTIDFFNKQATSKRGKDKKRDMVTYTTIGWTKDESKADPNQNSA